MDEQSKKKIAAIRDFINSAEKSVKNAKKLLKEILSDNEIKDTEASFDTKGLNNYTSEEEKIIEWVFTWEEMLGSDGNKYPIPANYSSKSKLVQWDQLKLSISQSWKMFYKQIKPIERETKFGLVTKTKWKYQVVSEGQTYDLLTAAVTHFKAEVWDSVSILVPAWKKATFAAIETVLPKEI